MRLWDRLRGPVSPLARLVAVGLTIAVLAGAEWLWLSISGGDDDLAWAALASMVVALGIVAVGLGVHLRRRGRDAPS